MPPILDLFAPHLASKTTAAGGCRGRGARGGVKDGDHGSVCGLRAPGAGGWGRGMEGRALPMLINMGGWAAQYWWWWWASANAYVFSVYPFRWGDKFARVWGQTAA